jgi:hypothetical protein
MENLYGKSNIKIQTNYENDLANQKVNPDESSDRTKNINQIYDTNQTYNLRHKQDIEQSGNMRQIQDATQSKPSKQSNDKIDFTSTTFTDTFEHFTKEHNMHPIEGYEGYDYSTF